MKFLEQPSLPADDVSDPYLPSTYSPTPRTGGGILLTTTFSAARGWLRLGPMTAAQPLPSPLTELLRQIEEHSRWLAVANQLYVQPETRHRFCPPYCRVKPLVPVAKGAATKLSEENRIRRCLARVCAIRVVTIWERARRMELATAGRIETAMENVESTGRPAIDRYRTTRRSVVRVLPPATAALLHANLRYATISYH